MIKVKAGKIKKLFLDIGGVLLTNGWDHDARQRAADHFVLDAGEMNERHKLTFDTYETGKLTLDGYLNNVIFYEKRSFSRKDFKKFMFAQSSPFEDTIEFFKELKSQHKLKVIALNNEGRELNDYRIEKFKLKTLFDAFISSSYVHLRKPDADIYKMACDISQTTPNHVLYIDDRNMFVEAAMSLGISSYHFIGLEAMKKEIMNYKL